MPNQLRKYILLSIWIVLVLSGPVTVVTNSPNALSSKDHIIILNIFQRIWGLLAFTFISTQVIIGSYMEKWIQFVGSKIFKWHIAEGLFAYGFALTHPLFESAIVYKNTGNAVKALLLLPNSFSQREIFLLFGKIAFLLLTITVFSAYFRTRPFFRKNWNKLHVLNYLIFYAIYFHMRVGTDVGLLPFKYVSWFFFAVITFSVLRRIYLTFKKVDVLKSSS